MKMQSNVRLLFPGQIAVFVLATAFAVTARAQEAQPTGEPQNTPPSAAQPSSSASTAISAPKEGFWGHVNPFARKKWVHRQIDPINDRLNELDEVNAKNAQDIKDVDARAQAGIRQAQSTADAANQTATAAGNQAQAANRSASSAATHVDSLNTTVNGLDQYHQINEVDVAFRSGQPVLSAAAKKQLDDLAAALAGHQGYILEMEAQSPLHGAAGMQGSEKLAEAVKRYLVTEHQIPVYRLHSVALGNAQYQTASEDTKPVRHSNVHVRLMENSLAAQGTAPPHDAVSSMGAERP